MTRAEFEAAHSVRVVRKDTLWEMRAVTWLLNLLPAVTRTRSNGDTVTEKRGDRFMQKYWTVYKRHPWGTTWMLVGLATQDPMVANLEWLRDHELVHVVDIRTALGWCRTLCLLLVFPIGVWFVERHAFLVDFRAKVRKFQKAADMLHQDYGCRVPKKRMIAWWAARMEEQS